MKLKYCNIYKVLFFLILISTNLCSQEQSRFERYIDSLMGINKQVKYKDIVAFENIRYDTVNKENNSGYFIEACFKALGIEAYLDSNSNFLKKGVDIEILIYIDKNGVIYDVAPNEKKLKKYILNKVKGRDFYRDYANKLKINGTCIPKVDLDFYRNLFEDGIVAIYKYGENVGGNSCRCN